jgi:hypothetical protein
MMIPTYEETAALPIVRQAELSVHPHPRGLRDYMRSEWFSIRKTVKPISKETNTGFPESALCCGSTICAID